MRPGKLDLPAKSATCPPSLLMVRRAWWAAHNSSQARIPFYKGKLIAPRYIPNREDAKRYQEQLHEWWNMLDDRARAFLGEDYRRLCTGEL